MTEPKFDRRHAERLKRQQVDYRERLMAHRGKATWGEKLVPLGEFRAAAAAAGDELSPEGRKAAARDFLEPAPDETPMEGPFSKIAVFGGVYNNHLALEALLEDATLRGAEAIYCLGDLGGFGPNPEKVRPLLEQGGVATIQGNYEQSLASGREDCNCGYTDPRDNHFAELSYRYTAERCSPEFTAWMGELPERRRVLLAGEAGERQLVLAHGSPRRVNEFLFASSAPAPFLEMLVGQLGSDGFLCTHTGLPWHRRLDSGADVVNVGVIGRPANDGSTSVVYAMVGVDPETTRKGTPFKPELAVELVPLRYDHASLAQEMRREELPEEFVETILTGWWTTCLEILPSKERQRSKH